MNLKISTHPIIASCIFLLTVGTTACRADYAPQSESTLFTTDQMRADINKSLSLIESDHYLSRPLDDEMSTAIFKRYFKTLDPTKMFFLASDIKEFEKYRFHLDDLIKAHNADPAFTIYKQLRSRVQERHVNITKLLESDFDFSKSEFITIDRKDAEWASSEADLNELWRKRIKNDFLTQKLSGTEEKKIRENLAKRYKRQYETVMQTKPEEVFEYFFNSYMKEIEPHTQYMSATTAENFTINLSLKLQGIGASLQKEDDHTVIKKLIKGGPAEKSGLIFPEDKIVGVGQSADTIENVIGWRLMDVVKNIRGEKGSKVFLNIQSESVVAGAPPKLITLTRDVIKLDEQAAQIHYQEIDNHNYGVIEIPSFYADSEARKTTSTDVERLLKQAKARNVDGIVVDLRGNGGGFLQEAISLTGLFIKKGPVVQIKNTKSRPYGYYDRDPKLVYDGPLVVMVDRYSASASEIFSGAIQDYGRGVVIGERTFGKGTVQRLAPLNKTKREVSSELKLTTDQFFRISGESTQHKGVVPDVMLDAGLEDEKFGERAYENALPWSAVGTMPHNKEIYPQALFDHLSRDHSARIKDNASFDYLQDSSVLSKEAEDIKVLPLSEKARKQVFNDRELARLELNNSYRKTFGLDAITLEDSRKPQTDLPDGEDHWKRVFQTEAVNVLDDLIRLTTPKTVSTEGMKLG